MALTKVQTIGIETGISLTGVTTITTINASTDTLSVGGTVNFGGNVSIAGTLTYEDVTNIDSVGIITARNGIKVDDLGVQVGTGATIDGATNTLTFLTNGSERLRVTSAGLVGIGIDNPKRQLHLDGGTGGANIQLTNDTTGKTTDGDGFQLQLATDGTARVVQRENLDLAFDTNNTERARFDSSGRFLVGTSSSRVVGSARKVQIEGTSDATAGVSLVRNSNDSNSPTINIGKSRGTSAGSNTVVQSGDGLGSIYFRGADGSDLNTIGVAIEAAVDGTPGSNDLPGRLVFSTTADGASSVTERMRIDSAGQVIIGSTSAAGLFSVHQSASSANYINITNGVTGSSSWSNGMLLGPNASGDALVWQNENLALRFGTNNTDRMRIAANGDVGIGIAPAAQKLQVHESTASTESYVHITNAVSGGTSSDGMLLGMSTSAEGIVWNAENTSLLFATNNTEKMRIDNSGRVGIKNTSPGSQYFNDLVVGDGSGDHGITLHTSTTGSSAIAFSDATSGTGRYAGYLQYDHTSNSMRFYVNAGNEQFRITSDGKIRIKMNSFGSDPSASNSGLQLFDTSGGSITSAAAVTSGSSHAVFLNPNGVCGTIQTSGSATSYNTSSDYRLKENVVDLDGAITRVKQLAPKRFNFISNAATTVDGFIAHEAQAVVPQAVSGEHNEVDENGDPVMQGMDYGKLTPLLTAALQEAISKIETLETKVAALEG